VVAIDPNLSQADEGRTTLSTFSAALAKIQIEWKDDENGDTLLTSISSNFARRLRARHRY